MSIYSATRGILKYLNGIADFRAISVACGNDSIKEGVVTSRVKEWAEWTLEQRLCEEGQ